MDIRVLYAIALLEFVFYGADRYHLQSFSSALTQVNNGRISEHHMDPLLQITIQNQIARVPFYTFQLEGEIDASSSQELEQAARQAYEEGMGRLLLDLSGLKFMGSAGLRALHTIDEMLRQQTESGGEDPSDGFKSPYLKIVNTSPSIARTLKISGFDMVFDIYQSQQQAIEAF